MLKCDIKKTIGPLQIDCKFTVNKRELLMILGASGCGKSTLLNLITGIKRPDDGVIALGDVPLYENKSDHVSIQNRRIGYIQQNSCLFPHMTVKENILYSVNKKDLKSEYETYKALVTLLGLESHENKYPTVLSGGQSQRVAIGRALMMKPNLLLWDEPFSALDHMIRNEMRSLVERVKKQLNIPMIFVTHDLDEAFQLSDSLAVMKDGEILQIGPRDKVFDNPLDRDSANILGVKNILEGHMVKNEKSFSSVKVGTVLLNCSNTNIQDENRDTSNPVYVGIRPEHILYVHVENQFSKDRDNQENNNNFDATILNIEKHIDSYKLKIMIKGIPQPLQMSIPRAISEKYSFEMGDVIQVLIKCEQIVLIITSQEV